MPKNAKGQISDNFFATRCAMLVAATFSHGAASDGKNRAIDTAASGLQDARPVEHDWLAARAARPRISETCSDRPRPLRVQTLRSSKLHQHAAGGRHWAKARTRARGAESSAREAQADPRARGRA